MPWSKLLAWATGQIDDALRQKLELVLEENRVYRALLDWHSPHWRLKDAERKLLAQKGKPLGKLLADVITIVQPATLLKWHRQLIAKNGPLLHDANPNRGDRDSQTKLQHSLFRSPARIPPGVMGEVDFNTSIQFVVAPSFDPCLMKTL